MIKTLGELLLNLNTLFVSVSIMKTKKCMFYRNLENSLSQRNHSLMVVTALCCIKYFAGCIDSSFYEVEEMMKIKD